MKIETKITTTILNWDGPTKHVGFAFYVKLRGMTQYNGLS